MTSSRVARLPRDQRRTQLLDSAAEVFTIKGFHAAAMDDIADTAGVSKPVLYQHFSSKLELYLALLEQACGRLLRIIQRALTTTEVNRDRVVATMGGFFHFVNEQRADFRLVFESDLISEPAVRRHLERLNDDIAEAVALVISEDTQLPHAQSKLLAISLTGVAQVSARYWASGSNEITLDDAVELVSRLVWRGIRGFPRTTPDGSPEAPTPA